MKLEYIIFIVIFLIPAYLLRFSVFGIPTNALEVLVGITFIAWLIDKIKMQNAKFLITSYSLPVTGITLLFFGLALGTLISPDIKTSLGALKSWFIVPMLFAFVAASTLQSADQKEKALWSLALSGIAVAVIATGYWFKGALTFDARLAAFYESPNMLAMYVAPALLIVTRELNEKRKTKNVKQQFKIQSFTFLVVILSFSFLVFNLIMARSFGAFIGIVGATIMYLSIERWGKHKEKLWKIIFIVLFSAGLLLPFFSLLIDPWAMGRSSLVSRLMVWQVSAAILKDHWLFGIGPGTFQDVYLAYQKQFPPYLEWAMPHPHNIFLATWLYAGLLGMIGFLLILYWFFQKSFTLPSTLYPLPFLIMFYLLLHGFIDNTLWRNDVAQIFYLTLFTGFDIRKGR